MRSYQNHWQPFGGVVELLRIDGKSTRLPALEVYGNACAEALWLVKHTKHFHTSIPGPLWIETVFRFRLPLRLDGLFSSFFSSRVSVAGENTRNTHTRCALAPTMGMYDEIIKEPLPEFSTPQGERRDRITEHNKNICLTLTRSPLYILNQCDKDKGKTKYSICKEINSPGHGCACTGFFCRPCIPVPPERAQKDVGSSPASPVACCCSPLCFPPDMTSPTPPYLPDTVSFKSAAA